MRRTLILLFSLFIFGLQAQISISKFSMPSVGESLKTYSTINVNVDFGSTGGSQFWDFSSLGKDLYQETELLDPSEGSLEISEASFIIKNGDFVERYFKKTDDFIEEIHLKSLDPIFNTFEISNSFAKNPIYRKGTIIYNQSYSYESRFEAPIAWDDLPDTITSGINLSLDSVRFNTNFIITDDIDAWGVVKLPDGEWDALRESRTTERFITIDMFFLGTWIEAPAELIEAFAGEFAAFLTPDTTFSYNFYTDKAIEVLASFNLDDNGQATNAEFKAGSEITDTKSLEIQGKSDIRVYPNPSYGNVTFNFDNCLTGYYTVQIQDVLGKRLWSTKYLHSPNSKPLQVDLSFLKKGTYLYSSYDAKGNNISTRRLVIINP